ncbi:MAG: site-specific integrase [Paludibacter sp.]|nr:site-specific integrase [Paludibacter sp.]
MFKFNSNGISLNLIRDVRNFTRDGRKLLKTDECPLKWCTTFQRKQVYYSTGINLNEADWLALNGGDGTKKAIIKEYRETLQKYYDSTIQKNLKQLAENGTFTFDLLNVRLSKSIGTDLKQTFRAKIQNLISNDKIGNANVYQCALRSIEIYNDKNILFSDITPKWLDKYQKYMEQKGLRYSTIGMYLRTLRAIMNEAKNSNIINSAVYPFGDKKKGKFEIPIGEGRELSMEIQDIKKIAEYDCPSKTIEMCRDLWIFSYLCNGTNFGDILRFKFSDIKDNEIYFYRKKTIGTTKKKIEIIAPILPEMQMLIAKWGNAPSAKGFIFPFLNGSSTEIEYKAQIHNVIRLTNKNIKKVTKELNLPDISTYNCRHSYTTILAKLRTPESYIDQATGHSQKSVTQGYIGKYNKKERIKYNSLLIWSKGRIRTINKNISWNK